MAAASSIGVKPRRLPSPVVIAVAPTARANDSGLAYPTVREARSVPNPTTIGNEIVPLCHAALLRIPWRARTPNSCPVTNAMRVKTCPPTMLSRGRYRMRVGVRERVDSAGWPADRGTQGPTSSVAGVPQSRSRIGDRGLTPVPGILGRSARPALTLPMEGRPARWEAPTPVLARHTYEAAVAQADGGQQDAAEVAFTAIMHLTPSDDVTEELRVRAGMWVAGLRRDRFELAGQQGAMSIYARLVQDVPTHLLSLVSEIRFMQGACWEMLGRNRLAARAYENVLARTPPTSVSLVARLNTRIGAALTKDRELEAAWLHIRKSNQLVESLGSPVTYSYAREKRAVLWAAGGEFDHAMDDLMEARLYIGPDSSLRMVQSLIAESSVLLGAGENLAASAQLDVAESLATQHSFNHQLASLRRMREAMPDMPVTLEERK